jgi:CRP/FNR family transcriptional regulator, cyclic AMP receptor protein
MPTIPARPPAIAAQVLMDSRGETGVPRMGRHGMALLSTVPLFAGLSRRHLHRIAGLAEQVTYGAGRPVVQAGSRGTGFYVVLEGTAKVTQGYSSRTLARLGPGDFFGEMAVIDREPRTASVLAETRLTTMRLSRSALRDIIKREPDVALRIMEELSRRVRTLQKSPSH